MESFKAVYAPLAAMEGDDEDETQGPPSSSPSSGQPRVQSSMSSAATATNQPATTVAHTIDPTVENAKDAFSSKTTSVGKQHVQDFKDEIWSPGEPSSPRMEHVDDYSMVTKGEGDNQSASSQPLQSCGSSAERKKLAMPKSEKPRHIGMPADGSTDGSSEHFLQSFKCRLNGSNPAYDKSDNVSENQSFTPSKNAPTQDDRNTFSGKASIKSEKDDNNPSKGSHNERQYKRVELILSDDNVDGAPNSTEPENSLHKGKATVSRYTFDNSAFQNHLLSDNGEDVAKSNGDSIIPCMNSTVQVQKDLAERCYSRPILSFRGQEERSPFSTASDDGRSGQMSSGQQGNNSLPDYLSALRQTREGDKLYTADTDKACRDASDRKPETRSDAPWRNESNVQRVPSDRRFNADASKERQEPSGEKRVQTPKNRTLWRPDSSSQNVKIEKMRCEILHGEPQANKNEDVPSREKENQSNLRHPHHQVTSEEKIEDDASDDKAIDDGSGKGDLDEANDDVSKSSLDLFLARGGRRRTRVSRVRLAACMLKYILFVVCFTIWIASVVAMAMGGWVLSERGHLVRDSASFLLDPSAMLCLLGAASFLAAFCGCLGALRENICLLRLFQFSMIGVLVLESVVALLVFIFYQMPEFRQMLTNGPEEVLMIAIRRYHDDRELGRWIDFIQKQFQCCGANHSDSGYLDWRQNAYFNCSPLNPSVQRCGVPKSCCIIEPGEYINDMCGFGTTDKQRSEVFHRIKTQGCMKGLGLWLSTHDVAIGAVFMAVILPQILCVIFARLLVQHVQRLRAKWRVLHNQE